MFTTTELALGDIAGPGAASGGADLRRVPDAVLSTIPCAARPSTRFVHRDGACRCFVGGPAPEFPDGVTRPTYRFAS